MVTCGRRHPSSRPRARRALAYADVLSHSGCLPPAGHRYIVTCRGTLGSRALPRVLLEDVGAFASVCGAHKAPIIVSRPGRRVIHAGSLIEWPSAGLRFITASATSLANSDEPSSYQRVRAQPHIRLTIQSAGLAGVLPWHEEWNILRTIHRVLARLPPRLWSVQVATATLESEGGTHAGAVPVSHVFT